METQIKPNGDIYMDGKFIGNVKSMPKPAVHPTPYEGQLQYVLDHGVASTDRTGVGTRRVFGMQARYDLAQGFPCITSKRVHWSSVVDELRWILSGSTNVNDLHPTTIWDEWADANGNLGPVYGKQWRGWESARLEALGFGHAYTKHVIDQIKWVVDRIRTNPDDRGLIVSAWNPADLDRMALRPCHTMFQFFVQDGKLSCQLYQRSADMFLGVPFNIASYALLTHMIAACTGLGVGEFIHTIGDAHIYNNHVDQVRTQLARDPKPLPQIKLTGEYQYPWEYNAEDIELIDYKPHPAIKAPVAV